MAHHDHAKHHPKWDHDEFLAFLLLYASMADMEHTEAERKFIQDKIHPGALATVQSEFDECKDYECLQVINKYRDWYYDTPEKRAELLARVEELFEIDGEYTITENNLFMMLKRIL